MMKGLDSVGLRRSKECQRSSGVACFTSLSSRDGVSQLVQLLDQNIADLHDHGRAAVELEGDEAGGAGVFFVVVDDVAHEDAVDLLLQVVALGDDVHFVPFRSVLDLIGELLRVSYVFHLGDGSNSVATFGFDGFRAGDDRFFASLGEDRAEFFAVVSSGPLLFRVKVRLIASDAPAIVFSVELKAAILHATVVAFDAVFEFEFKIGEFHGLSACVFAGENDEGVAVGRVLFRGCPRDGPILDRPEFRVAVPAIECFSIEEGLPVPGVGEGGCEEGESGECEGFHGS